MIVYPRCFSRLRACEVVSIFVIHSQDVIQESPLLSMASNQRVIEPNKLAFDGSGYLAWEGLICMQEIGKCTEEHQAIVRKWLEERKLDEVRTSELFDVWWD